MNSQIVQPANPNAFAGTGYNTPTEGNTALPFTTNSTDIAGLRQLIIDYGTAWSKGPRLDILYIKTTHSVETKTGFALYQASLIMRDIDPRNGKYGPEQGWGQGKLGYTVQEALLRLLEALSDTRKKKT